MKKLKTIFFYLTSSLFLLSLLYNIIILGVSSLIEAIDMFKQKSYSLNSGTTVLTFLLSIILLICIIAIVRILLLKCSLNKKILLYIILVFLSCLCVSLFNILDVGYFDLLKYFTVSVFTFDFTFGVSVIPFLCSLTYLNMLFIAFLLCVLYKIIRLFKEPIRTNQGNQSGEPIRGTNQGTVL